MTKILNKFAPSQTSNLVEFKAFQTRGGTRSGKIRVCEAGKFTS